VIEVRDWLFKYAFEWNFVGGMFGWKGFYDSTVFNQERSTQFKAIANKRSKSVSPTIQTIITHFQ